MSKKLLYFFIGAFLFLGACNTETLTSSSDKEFVVLYTNDEHGWMEANEDFGGAPGMLAHWEQEENFDKSDKFLVLSGGDTWSGPAISSWFKGQPMIEAMNELHYDAAALGNHEFDGEVENLVKLNSLAHFPFLAANISYKSNGEIPDFVKPYVVIEKQGVKFGIIGLASLSTPTTTFPAYVEDFNFTDYEEALKKYVPLARADGAEVLLLTGHICENEMDRITSVAKELGIIFIGGAHCHQKVLENDGEIVKMQARSYYKAYGKLVFTYNQSKKDIKIISAEIKDNTPIEGEVGVQKIVDFWSAKTDSILDKPIGFASKDIYRGSAEMANMVTDSWLVHFPNANVSITNSGGIRQDINEGVITLETIVGVLPFNNNIVQLELTGKQLIESIRDYELGGMSTTNGYKLNNGTPIQDDSIYIVLTTDYLYSVPTNTFAKYDSTPYNTSIQYRDPMIEWIESKNTTEENPINNYLDYRDRH